MQANALAPNWGQVIFQSANEIANNQLAKARMAELQTKVPEEKEWWERRKQGIQEGFMKELDDDAKNEPLSPQANRKTGSDDDAVLVDADEAVGAQGSQTPTSAKKKKKNRK